jgi:hypothetical protein
MQPPSGTPDAARVTHRVAAAGEAAPRFALAPRAAALGAHREAAALYAQGSASRIAYCPSSADLLEWRSYACYVTGQFEEALQAQEQVLSPGTQQP